MTVWASAIGPCIDDVEPTNADYEAEPLLESCPSNVPSSRYVLNTATNYIHLVARHQGWERVRLDRTKCGKDYRISNWLPLETCLSTHERDGASHMVFKCTACAKPLEWAQITAASVDIPSDSD